MIKLTPENSGINLVVMNAQCEENVVRAYRDAANKEAEVRFLKNIEVKTDLLRDITNKQSVTRSDQSEKGPDQEKSMKDQIKEAFEERTLRMIKSNFGGCEIINESEILENVRLIVTRKDW